MKTFFKYFTISILIIFLLTDAAVASTASGDDGYLDLTGSSVRLGSKSTKNVDIIVGSTSNEFNVNIGGTEELTITSSAFTIASSNLSITAGNFTLTDGDLIISAADEGIILGETAVDTDVGFGQIYTFGTAAAKFAQGVADANDTHVAFYKSRATDGDADTVVQSGDDLGSIDFYGADGDTFALAARIYSEVDTTPGDGDMPGSLIFQVSADGAEAPATALEISNDKLATFAGGVKVGSDIVSDTDGGDSVGTAAVNFGDAYFGDGTDYIHLDEDELTSTESIVIGTGDDAGEDATIALNGASSDLFVLQDDGSTVNFQITQAGVWSSSAGLDLGLEYVAAANTACTTTCGVADGGALFGVDLAGGAASPVIVEADDADADACLCLELTS